MTPILRASVVAFLVLATCISHGQDTRVRTVPTDSCLIKLLSCR